MNYSDVTNPQWNRDGSAIDCMVNFESLGILPFAAVENDNTQHGREIYARCVAGDFGPIADYIPAPDEGPQEPSIPPEKRIPVTNSDEIL